jgi:hypothetical protein
VLGAPGSVSDNILKLVIELCQNIDYTVSSAGMRLETYISVSMSKGLRFREGTIYIYIHHYPPRANTPASSLNQRKSLNMKISQAVSLCSIFSLSVAQGKGGISVPGKEGLPADILDDLRKIPSIMHPNDPINSKEAMASKGTGKFSPAVSLRTWSWANL